MSFRYSYCQLCLKINVSSYRISTKNIPYLNFPRITGRLLSFVGIPAVKQANVGMPQPIKNAPKKVKRAFIQQFFDDEGWPEPNQMRVAISQCVNCTSQLPREFIDTIKDQEIIYLQKIPIKIRETIAPPKILEDIEQTLREEFGIYSKIRFKRLLVRKDHITGAFELEIQRKRDIQKFFKVINFSSSSKKKKLEFMLNRDRSLPEDSQKVIIETALKLLTKKKYFCAYELARDLKLPQSPVRKKLKSLVRMGVFKKEKEKYFLTQ